MSILTVADGVSNAAGEDVERIEVVHLQHVHVGRVRRHVAQLDEVEPLRVADPDRDDVDALSPRLPRRQERRLSVVGRPVCGRTASFESFRATSRKPNFVSFLSSD